MKSFDTNGETVYKLKQCIHIFSSIYIEKYVCWGKPPTAVGESEISGVSLKMCATFGKCLLTKQTVSLIWGPGKTATFDPRVHHYLSTQ